MPLPIVFLVLILSIPGPTPDREYEYRMHSIRECFELAEAWVEQPTEAPIFADGAVLLASCRIVIAETRRH